MPARPGSIDGPVAVVAHRGASAEATEHTLAAYDLAVEQGADSIEIDVRPTSDGVLVCVHDATLERLAGVTAVVDRTPWEELADLPIPAVGGAPVQPLVRVEVVLDRLAAGDLPGVHVELKDPDRYDGTVEARLLGLLADRGLLGDPRVVVETFDADSLARIRARAGDVTTGLLWTRSSGHAGADAFADHVAVSGPNVFSVFFAPEHVAAAHERGRPVHVWTADDPEEVEALLDLGVDAIVTNRPAVVRSLVDARTS